MNKIFSLLSFFTILLSYELSFGFSAELKECFNNSRMVKSTIGNTSYFDVSAKCGGISASNLYYALNNLGPKYGYAVSYDQQGNELRTIKFSPSVPSEHIEPSQCVRNLGTNSFNCYIGLNLERDLMNLLSL